MINCEQFDKERNCELWVGKLMFLKHFVLIAT